MTASSEPMRPGGFQIVSLIVVLAVWGCNGPQAESPTDEASPDVWFTDVTSGAGLGEFRHLTGAVGKKWMPETLGGGGGFLDYDADGRQDILLVRGAEWSEEGADPSPALALYRNNGDGSFSETTSEAGLSRIHAYAFGVTAADYDNDGDQDFYVTALGKNMLFRNDGGTFVEAADRVGISGPEEWSTAAVFFDADRDGLLDLYVGNYVRWTPAIDTPCSLSGGVRSYCTPDLYEGLPGRFYRNNGDGSFVEATDESGFGGLLPGKTLAAMNLDYNADGWDDLIVINDTERNLLYENNGDGTFTEKGILAGIAFDKNGKARAGMGVDAGVMDSTGQPTIFISNFAREMVGAYRYDRRGMFTDRALEAGIARESVNLLSFGLFVFDADLDGHLDVFTANGHIMPEIGQVDGVVPYKQPARLYRNRGNGTFEVVSEPGDQSVWDRQLVARGAAYADIDADGDLDVLLVENGGPAHLWRNEVNGRYFRVSLDGSVSNRNGIGARVVAVADGLRMTQFARSGASYLSQSERVLTFGLGKAEIVDTLLVYWPSTEVDTLLNVPANQTLRVVEATTNRLASR